ncbi:unnamed protein product [Soboliphyme baturini]|uniref:Dentin sialophosphoprotein-like n=1 Tax=Soboliphyme baturini TaxID=241478 RepID=A0A183J2V5_9BILA|nr:unnamed protein product [Soboliphyme baturini]
MNPRKNLIETSKSCDKPANDEFNDSMPSASQSAARQISSDEESELDGFPPVQTFSNDNKSSSSDNTLKNAVNRIVVSKSSMKSYPENDQLIHHTYPSSSDKAMNVRDFDSLKMKLSSTGSSASDSNWDPEDKPSKTVSAYDSDESDIEPVTQGTTCSDRHQSHAPSVVLDDDFEIAGPSHAVGYHSDDDSGPALSPLNSPASTGSQSNEPPENVSEDETPPCSMAATAESEDKGLILVNDDPLSCSRGSDGASSTGPILNNIDDSLAEEIQSTRTPHAKNDQLVSENDEEENKKEAGDLIADIFGETDDGLESDSSDDSEVRSK